MGPLSSLLLAFALLSSASEVGAYHPPHTPQGAPDFEGVWTNTALTMLERPAAFKGLVATDAEAANFEAMFAKMIGIGDTMVDPKTPPPPKVKSVENSEWVEMSLHLAQIHGQRRTSWIIDPADGKIPFTTAGKAARDAAEKESFDGPENRPLSERCLTGVGSPEGPPMMNTGYNANYQIIQTPDAVIISIEMIHDVRVIRLSDRHHPPLTIRPWLGDSVGWFEGDTLVVETTNLNPKSYVESMGGGFTYSSQAKLIERFTRTGDHALLYEFEVDDPVNFKRPWKAEMPWRTAQGPLYEYACHEGNYSLPLALSGTRALERKPAAAQGPQIAGK